VGREEGKEFEVRAVIRRILMVGSEVQKESG
jgi:hypothetical protein